MSCRVISDVTHSTLRRARRLAIAGVCSSVWLLGCALDNRPLEVGSAGSASGGAGGSSSQTAGASNAGRAGSPASAGDAGESPVDNGGSSGSAGAGGPPLVGGCADLDMNQVPDCQETIVQNPDLKADVTMWVADPDTQVDWDQDNAGGDVPSGSALVSSPGVIDANAVGAALRAASQCVPVNGVQLVTAYGNAFVDPGQDQQGHAEIDVFFFDQADCAGSSSNGFSTPQPLDTNVGAWITLKAGSVSSASTKSALVKLAISKPFHADAFQARFDNVLVRAEAP